jgi:hypothetical protein
VFKIRQFFKERNAMNYIDTAMLVRHAVAFGFYLATTVIAFLSLSVAIFFPENPLIWKIVTECWVVYNIGSFIA